MNIRDILISFMKEKAYKPMTVSELAAVFGVGKHEMKDFKKLLKSMEREGKIIKTRTEHYGVPERMGLIVGRFQGNSKGYGFVICEEERQDIFIPITGVNGAMNGDKVLVKITRHKLHGKKSEGEVHDIIERANKTVIGVFEESEQFGFVVPYDKRIYQDIFISKEQINGAKDGQIVVAEITKWPKKRRNPEGRIIEILGNKGDKGIDILTIIRKHKLPEKFSQKVLNYAEGIPEEIAEQEYKTRRDLRDLRMVTIDGEDAKDLDDAVSIERLPNGNYKLGVHIADVSYYVREKNVLDKEAFKRGTSIYLIDRVVPMLPKKLSNGVCSLNPKVDRLALTCMMEINKKGKVVEHEIFESIIKTNERMTYKDVTKILRDNDEELIEKYRYLYDDFKTMEELCLILNEKRTQRGSIDFDFEESKIILDKLGKPIDIKPYERAIANRIIEEFMLVCNETVAEYMYWTKVPFVYRIHEEPDEEKLMYFSEFIHNLGYVFRINQQVHPRAMQEILEKVKGKKEETVVSTLMLRSMMKAKYSPECVGHFGLAARYYCHFTSPIRRYPDLIIHRIIKEFLHGEINEKRERRLKAEVESASIQSSDRERAAMEAEREVEDLKKAEYMSERIGEEYDGIISSVTNFGFFVELSNTVEGLVHMSSLDDDYYIFDEAHLCLIGENSKKIFKLGDEVKIKVDRVEMDSHEVYFKLIDDYDKNDENDYDENNENDYDEHDVKLEE